MLNNLVILGATGDLTERLLLPGLAQALHGAPDQRLTLIGAAEQATPRWEEVVRAAFAAAQARAPRNGVPVILRSGRAIGDPRQEVRVVFKQHPHVYGPFCERVERNVLRVGLEQEEVTLEVDVGNPSRVTALQRVQLRAAAEQTHVSAYGNVVRWLLESNPAFMVRADGAEQGWRIRYTVLAEEGGSPLLDYPAGSTGPS